jgi:hypothetical protein
MSEKDGQLAHEYILEVLKGDGNANSGSILAFRDTAFKGKYNNIDENAIAEAWLDLFLNGWISPDNRSGDWLNSNWFRVTSYGKSQLGIIGDDYYPVFLDPISTISGLSSTIHNMDSIALKYFEEALWAIKKNLFLSAIVTMGCASECSILLLIDAMLDYYDDITLRERFNKFDKIKPRYGLFKKTIEEKGLKKELLLLFESNPSKYDDLKHLFIDFDTTLDRMFHIYRTNRNDAGHPSGIEFDQDITRAEAAMFRKYCKIIYGLIAYMNEGKGLKKSTSCR